GTRLAHVMAAGELARKLSVLFDQPEADLLVAAATLHDIGYSPRIAETGFHPLDGARYLRAERFPDRLACLVAHHSLAIMSSNRVAVASLIRQFPREESLLADALVFADMHSAPDGRIIPVEQRLDDICERHLGPGTEPRVRLLGASIERVRQALQDIDASVDPVRVDEILAIDRLR
ncbi:MAG: HD domain-containing protein, partial [Actinomycetes bacterium]